MTTRCPAISTRLTLPFTASRAESLSNAGETETSQVVWRQ